MVPPNNDNPAIVLDLIGSACPKCHSTHRTYYSKCVTVRHKGMKNGKEYNRIDFKRCRCAKCGQTRVDKYFLLDSEPTPEKLTPRPERTDLNKRRAETPKSKPRP